jgi:putative ABC transport system permease protein
MRWLLAGVTGLLRRRRIEQDLDEELQAFLNAAAEEFIARGMSREEALRAARLSVGNLAATKDVVRDVGWESRVEDLARDVRDAWRGSRRSPGFTAVAVLTLALGIGANTALFSIVNALLLRALPVAAPWQLVTLESRRSIEQDLAGGWPYPVWDHVQRRSDAFAGAVAWTVFPERLDLAQGGESDPAEGIFASWNLFDELGVTPVIGRLFTAGEDVLGHPNSRVALVSHGFWQRRFGGSTDIVGHILRVQGVPVTVVGVTPPDFFGPEVGRAFDIALPLGSAPILYNDDTWGTPTGFSYLKVMLRLRPQQSVGEATATLRGMQRNIIEAAFPAHPIWGPPEDMITDPFVLMAAMTGTSELRRQYSRALMAVMTVAALLLLIVCANVSHLRQARAAARQHELSTRLALGAPPWRLAQQLIVESLVLAGIGAAVGLLLAVWSSRVLVAQLSTLFDRIVLDVSLDWRVMVFSAAAAIGAAVLSSTAPALRTSVISVAKGARSSARRGRLVAAQVALSLVLLVTAGLFVRTSSQIAAVPLGLESDRVLVVDVNARRASVAPENRAALYQRLVEAVEALPGVTHAAASQNTPLNPRSLFMVTDVDVRGRPPLPESGRRVVVNFVTPNYFSTYGLQLRAGRTIDNRDARGGLRVAVVNEAFVQHFLPDVDPIGKVITGLPQAAEAGTPTTIIGVVNNAIDQRLRDDASPVVYQPLAQWETHGSPQSASGFPQPAEIGLGVRTGSVQPILLARSVAAALAAVDRDLTFSFRPLADQVADASHQERLVAWLSAVFGALALFLAAIGLYGVTSYGVKRRRAEIAVRMALGAQRWDVIGLALRHTAMMAAIGVAIGLVVATALTRYLEALLFGITPLDPLTFVAASAILVSVSLVASYLPARRAASVDPTSALRCE